jgi:hypothetical protein
MSKQHPHPLLFLLLSATLLCGCAQTDSVSSADRSGGIYSKFIPADKTATVGTAVAVDPYSGYVVLERNRAPFDAGAFLVARDSSHNPTAVLETSGYTGSSYPSQGLKIISGHPQTGDEIVDPGRELAKYVQRNIDQYVAYISNSAAPGSTAVNSTTTTTETASPSPTASTSPTM